MKLNGMMTTATLALGLALIAGCGDDSAENMDRLEPEPAARISDDAIGTPADERDTAPDMIDERQNDQNY